MLAPNVFHLLDVVPHVVTSRNWWNWKDEASLVGFVKANMTSV
jgi:hypothetical protein